ncbi:MAG: helix-turn-helix domain-containing protein [Nitrospinaceae bacterium]|nr:helix-turn-helix transcriptional regulator [Nitrospinaceae bacterium]NIR55253.1 helix-turn-helix transcriptional regulator [Nitrospinaceae bacterium]NIS85691.1 helix-turn-helix transcriptional regulator [Nitrospinaceae bacterium]NIT82542.1 helix-turn-helix transcriptional regulator [Nitrospinaceae bacterium]NIU44746.1 helix-turn-helix transcriptional regulator [Nitrospinaceae bacterium]
MKTKNLAKIFKALSNESRLELFRMIYGQCQEEAQRAEKAGKECCEGIEKAFTLACGCLDLSRSTISHHFKELQNAGLITCTRQGQTFLCQVNEEHVEAVRDFLKP